MTKVEIPYIGIALVLIFIVVALGVYAFVKQDIDSYTEYKNFCKERPAFCYCDWGECEFKTSSSTSYTNGILTDDSMSNDTTDLCKLATRLNDKEMLFKIGCK